MGNNIIKQIVDESKITYDIGVNWDNIELPNGSSLSSVNQLPTNLIKTDDDHQFMTQNDKDKISIINEDNKISTSNIIEEDNSKKFVSQTEKNKISIINGDNKISVNNIEEDSNKKFVSQTEKDIWNGKQNKINKDNKLSADLINVDTSHQFVTQEDKNKISIINTNKKISADNVQETESKKFMTQEDKNKMSAINKNNQIDVNKIATSATQQFVSQTEKDIWNGKQDKINKDNKLSADLIKTDNSHQFMTQNDKERLDNILKDGKINHHIDADKVDTNENYQFITKAEKNSLKDLNDFYKERNGLEKVDNRSSNLIFEKNNTDTKYPTIKAVREYVQDIVGQYSNSWNISWIPDQKFVLTSTQNKITIEDTTNSGLYYYIGEVSLRKGNYTLSRIKASTFLQNVTDIAFVLSKEQITNSEDIDNNNNIIYYYNHILDTKDDLKNDISLENYKFLYIIAQGERINNDNYLKPSENPSIRVAIEFTTSTGSSSSVVYKSKISPNRISEDNNKQFVSQTEKNVWNKKQNNINENNKLSANLINQTNDLKFVTSDEKGQIAEASRAIQEDFYTKEQTYDRKTIDSNYELKTDKINDLIKSVSNVDESKKSPTTTAIKEYIRYNNAREYLNWTNNKYLSYDNTTTNVTSLIRDSGKTYTYVSDAIYLAQNEKIYIQTYLGKNHFNNLTNPCSVIIKTTNDVDRNDDVVKHWLIDNNSGYKTYTFDNIKSEDSSNPVIGNQGLYVYICASQTLDPAIKPQNNLDITIQILNDSDKIKKIYNASIIKANRVAQDDKNYQFVSSDEKNKWNSILDDNGKLAKNIPVKYIETNQQNRFVSQEQIDSWSNKQAAINADNKITSNFIDDESQEQKFVTEEEKDKWNEAIDGLIGKEKLVLIHKSIKENHMFRNTNNATLGPRGKEAPTDAKMNVYLYDLTNIKEDQSIIQCQISFTTSIGSSFSNVPYVLRDNLNDEQVVQDRIVGEATKDNENGKTYINLGDVLQDIRKKGYIALAIIKYNSLDPPEVSAQIMRRLTKEKYETDKQELQNNINEKIQKPNSIIPDVYSYDSENSSWKEKEDIPYTSIDFDLSNDIEPKFEDFTFEENDQILGLDSLTSQIMIRGIEEGEDEGYTVTDNYYIVSENNNDKIKNVLIDKNNNYYIIDKKRYNKNGNDYTIENVDIIDDETYNRNIANGNYIVYNKYYIETNSEDSNNNDKIKDKEDSSIINDKIFSNKPKLFSHCYLNVADPLKNNRKIILGNSDDYKKAYILIAPVQSEDIIKIYGQSDKSRHQWFFINKNSSSLTTISNTIIEVSNIIIPSSNNEIISEDKRKEFIYTIKVPDNVSHIVISGYIYLPRIYKMIGFQKKRPWSGKKWCVIGDSLTEKNAMTFKNYADYISDATGIEVINLGLSGSGYKKKFNEQQNNAFFGDRLNNFEEDIDVVTIIGGVNDATIKVPLCNKKDKNDEPIPEELDTFLSSEDNTIKDEIVCVEPDVIYETENTTQYYGLIDQRWQSLKSDAVDSSTTLVNINNKKLIFNGDIYLIKSENEEPLYYQWKKTNNEWTFSKISEDSLLYDELKNNKLFVGDILDNLYDDESYKIDNMSLMGCVNKLINRLEKNRPDIQIGIMSSVPIETYNMTKPDAVRFVNALEKLCRYRNIPFLNLFYSSNLRAWDQSVKPYLYARDSATTGPHPSERAHKLFAPKIKNFLNNFIL